MRPARLTRSAKMGHSMHDPDSIYTASELAADLHLIATSKRLYPESAYLQTAWLRAITIVRTTANGWLLETPVVRLQIQYSK
jgi:hypothetical protein